MIPTIETYNGIETAKIDEDVYGNPRYVVHFLDFLTESERKSYGLNNYKALIQLAVDRSKKIGGKKYRAKWYRGGIVFHSYNIRLATERINEIVTLAEKNLTEEL